ncbi:Mbov_0399 family ICE element protein [Mesomycoplasma hyopneumoniae]|uniref:Mbov_0399 family ICE element protein n=1 Tax=Mesomycoplasma hyopneumoniae TaxID=2099 RepID=UPI001004E4AF|nr:hypothetical protein [Mesomycoplasma hyopneumoniae]VEU66118.1 Uncharacterised protein [Mesomycoplasma hyopneumoniae]VEU66379.1 Uncharacterised protein [Mesomycoplasma hyopneumoniae]
MKKKLANNKLNKAFLLGMPFFSLITYSFLVSESVELPVYNLEIKKDDVWSEIPTKTEYSLTVTKKNVNFSLEQTNKKNWVIFVGDKSPYQRTGQNDIQKYFSKDWFNTYEEVSDFHSGSVSFYKSKIPDGVYNLNNKPSNAIPDDNFEIVLDDIKPSPNNANYFGSDFFTGFNITLSNFDSQTYKYNDYKAIDESKLGKKLYEKFKKENEGLYKLTKIKLNFQYTVKNSKIIEISTTIRAVVQSSKKIQVDNPESIKLRNYMSNLKKSFENEFPNHYEIQTDTGADNGLDAEKASIISSDTNKENIKTNKQYFEEKIKNWWEKNKKQTSSGENPPYGASYHYNKWQNSKNPADIWIEFQHPLEKKKYKFYLVNASSPEKFPTVWKPTPFLLQKEFTSRLELIPSEVWKYDPHLKGLIKQRAEKKQDIQDQEKLAKSQEKEQGNNIYGGQFEFVGDVQVKFHAAKDESEVLFINGKKIDVLDNQFQSVLQDLRLEQNENGGTNKYKIEIKKFKQDKNEVEKTYTIDLITKSVVNVLEGKWFGWDPEKNLAQKRLISQYLLDDSGKEIINENGKKIENPGYDPNIDPKTGTKKQILWVRNNGADLKDNVFYQDPNILEKGFIAEGAVVGKGINLTFSQNFQDDKVIIKKYKIDQSQKNTFSLAPKTTQFSSTSSSPEGEEIKINNNENDYFSNSGLWLFRVGYEFDQQNFKIFLIGDNDNTKLFSDIISSNIYIPFWHSIAGKHLEKYLKEIRGFNNNYIKALSYEKIMQHWKSYINYKLDKREIQDPISEKIQTRINNKLEEEIKKRQTINFSSEKEIVLNNLDFSDLNTYLTDKQKENLKNIKLKPYQNNGNWSFELDKNITESLNLANSHFEFPGLKTDKELEELKKTKTKLEIGDIEGKLKDLIRKNAFDEPDSLINKASVFLNYQLKDKNIGLEIRSDKEGILEVKLLPDEKHYLEKDYYKFNLKKLQENARDNYDTFYELPKDLIINLDGLSDPKKAAEHIKKQISLLSHNKLEFGKDYDFNTKLLENPDLFRVYQGSPDNLEFAPQHNFNLSGIDLPGYLNIKLTNIVPNIKDPKETNLSKINLDKIIINSNNPQEIIKELEEKLDKQLKPYGLNWKEYLKVESLDSLLEKIRHNKISNIELLPGNYLTSGNLKVEIENFGFEPYKFDLKNQEESQNFLQNKKNLYWFIPLTITVLAFLSFGIWFLIRKKFKKFH